MIKFANMSNRDHVCLLYLNETMIFNTVMQNVDIEFWQDLHHYCLPYKKVTMITSTCMILVIIIFKMKRSSFLVV